MKNVFVFDGTLKHPYKVADLVFFCCGDHNRIQALLDASKAARLHLPQHQFDHAQALIAHELFHTHFMPVHRQFPDTVLCINNLPDPLVTRIKSMAESRCIYHFSVYMQTLTSIVTYH